MASTSSLQTIHLKADNFEENTAKAFRLLGDDTVFTDVTLVTSDDQRIPAHKVILSSSSLYLRNILESQSMAFKATVNLDIKHAQLDSVIDYIYRGYTRVKVENMKSFLQVVQLLQIQGLSKPEIEDDPKLHQYDSPEIKIEEYPSLSENKNKCVIKMDDEQFTAKLKRKTDKSRYSCDHCLFKTKFKRYLISHTGKEHPAMKVQCEECGYVGSEAGLKQHKIKHKGETYACDQCAYQTTIKYRLNEHIKTMHDIEYIYCDECIFRTKRTSNLTTHVEIEHNGIRFTCEYCGLEFKKHSRFKDHKLSVHEGNQYQCEECDYTSIFKGT